MHGMADDETALLEADHDQVRLDLINAGETWHAPKAKLAAAALAPKQVVRYTSSMTPRHQQGFLLLQGTSLSGTLNRERRRCMPARAAGA